MPQIPFSGTRISVRAAILVFILLSTAAPPVRPQPDDCASLLGDRRGLSKRDAGAERVKAREQTAEDRWRPTAAEAGAPFFDDVPEFAASLTRRRILDTYAARCASTSCDFDAAYQKHLDRYRTLDRVSGGGPSLRRRARLSALGAARARSPPLSVAAPLPRLRAGCRD